MCVCVCVCVYVCVCVCACLQLHPWMTQHGADPLPLEEEHCTAVEVTEEEVQNSIRLIPSLSAVVSSELPDTWTLAKYQRSPVDRPVYQPTGWAGRLVYPGYI